MIAFPNDKIGLWRLGFGLASLSVIFGFSGQAAWAQVGPPTPLFPPTADQPAAPQPAGTAPSAAAPLPADAAATNSAATPALPPAAPGSAGGEVLGPAASRSTGAGTSSLSSDKVPSDGAPSDNAAAHAAIDTAPLAALNPLAAADGEGLSASLWRGTSLTTAAALFPQWQPSPSPSLQSLALRLLGSEALPEGVADATQHAVWLAIRAEKLEALGHPDLALALLRAAPADQMSPDMAQVMADLAFLSGDVKGGCGLVAKRQPNWNAPFWDEAQITCQIVNGDSGPAQIGLDALREVNVKDDAFVALAQKALGTPVKLPQSWPNFPALALPLYAKAGEGLPHNGLENAPPALLRAAALDNAMPVEARVVAAEKAAAFGVISPERLAEIYTGLPMDKLGDPTKDKAAGGAKGRAILFASARDTPDPAMRGNLLAEYLGKAAKAGFYQTAARAAAPMIVAMQPTAFMKPVAEDLARALYVSGKPVEALGWAALLESGQRARLSVIAHLTEHGAEPWPTVALAESVGGEGRQTAGVGRAALAMRLLGAAGIAVPDTLALPLYTEVKGGAWSLPLAGPGLLIANNAEAKRVGATILGVLVSLGADGASASPALVERAIMGLAAAGLDQDARRLALDAAIAQGF